MLLVGILRHGYGAWVPIRDDAELGMQDKFFLEEHRVEKKEERSKGANAVAKSPGAVHLVRRADYLLSVLKAQTSNGTNLAAKRAVENHHRNNKKNGMHKQMNGHGTGSASPAPSGVSKSRRPDKHHHRDSTHRRISTNGDISGHTPQPDGAHRGHDHQNGGGQRRSEHQRGDSQDQKGNVAKVFPPHFKALFKPIRESLNAVKSATKHEIPDKQERARILRTELVSIGDHIRVLYVDAELEDGTRESREAEASFW